MAKRDKQIPNEEEALKNENEAEKNKVEENEKVSFKAKSNTGFPNYFRAGFRFTPAFKEYEASKEVYDSLKKDNHLTLSSEIE